MDFFFFDKQKTAYEMRISYWSSDVCSSDLGYSPGDMARDLAGLLDHLQIDQAHFIAHSFGGVVALKLACEQPRRVSSLVLADCHIAAVRRLEAPQQWHYGREDRKSVV